MFAGELTEKGFNLRQAILWNEYKEYLQAEGKELVKKPPTTPQYEQKDPEQIEDAAGNVQEDNSLQRSWRQRRNINREMV